MPLPSLLAGPDYQMPVLHNPEQPCSKRGPAGIETMDSSGRNDTDLLGQLLGHAMPAVCERHAEPVHRVKVPLKQLPPCLLAAPLCGVYRKRLGIWIH